MKLELYKYDTCPYCIRVMRVINQLAAPVELRDIHQNVEDMATLVQAGGKCQVPCLFIDGHPLYESSDIIAWLQEHFG